MLHTKSEVGTPRRFAAGTRKLLNELAGKLWLARHWEAEAKVRRSEVTGTLIDLFGLIAEPGSAAYQLDNAGEASQVLCLDLGVRYETDDEKLAKVLGDRLELVLTLKPQFDSKKAEAAIKTGIITEAEMAQCLTPVARPAAVLRDAGDVRTPKGIPPGEGRVNPMTLAKGLKLDWGERG